MGQEKRRIVWERKHHATFLSLTVICKHQEVDLLWLMIYGSTCWVINVITYCTFPLTFPLSQCESLFPKSTISICMHAFLAITIILHGSLKVCDAFELPNATTHILILQGSGMISCDLQVKSNQIQFKALLTPPLMSHLHLLGTFKMRWLPLV